MEYAAQHALDPEGVAPFAAVDDVADLIIMRFEEIGTLSLLKLQKLVYYVQAWHLAFTGNRCFNGDFQAWIHGPVNRSLYDRFKETKYLYSSVHSKDVRNVNCESNLTPEIAAHIRAVLSSYGQLSDDQLETMTHLEDPWIEARAGFKPNERCEVVISDTTMRDFYRNRMISNG